MLCHEFNQRLHNILDQRGQPELDEALSNHAAVCGDCAERLAIQAVVIANCTIRSTRALRPGFAAKVVQQAKVPSPLPSDPVVLSRSLPRWPLVAVFLTATAAACLLWFSPAWRSHPDEISNRAPNSAVKAQGGTLAISTSQPAAKSPAEAQPSTIAPSAPGNMHEYEEQIRQWVHTLPEAVERMEDVDLQLMEEYAPGLRSLRTSLSIALDTLRRSLPGHREGQKLEGAWRNPPMFAPA